MSSEASETSSTACAIESLVHQNEILKAELERIYRSRSWRVARWLSRLFYFRPKRLRGAIRWLLVRRRIRNGLRRACPELPWQWGLRYGGSKGVQFVHHRCGWTYAVEGLCALDRHRATYFDGFVEYTFQYRATPPETHLGRWSGICHVPPCMPEWLPPVFRRQFFVEYSRSFAWESGLRHCVGLFALSEYHAAYLREKTGLEVHALYHPTEIPALQWSAERFRRNERKRVIQIGWWLRRIHAIFQASFPGYEKTLLQLTGQRYVEDYLKAEREFLATTTKLTSTMLESATVMPYVPHADYDRLLSENLVFLDLYDSSANNSVIECMARGTPLLVNPLPAVVEYLGTDYPLYFTSHAEAAAKAADFSLLEQASAWLKSPEIREKITRAHFIRSLMQSRIFAAMNR